MKRQSLTALLLVAAFGASSGCASSGKSHFWANPLAGFRQTSTGDNAAEKPAEKSSEEGSALALLKNRFRREKSADEELSPEFREAQKTLKKNPERTLLAWARYQEDIGEYGEARKMYRELQIAYPDNIQAHLGMARIELLTGRSQQAEQILAGLVEDNPDSIDVRLALGQMYSHQEQWDKATRAFEAACEIEPENQDCRYELGIAFARSGDYDRALAHLTFAVGEPAAHYNIGYLLHENGKDADAAEWFQNALQMHPDNQTAEKSKAMLAKLGAPVDRQNVVTQHMVARQTPQPTRAAVEDRRATAPEDLPIIAGNRKRSGSVDFEQPPADSVARNYSNQNDPIRSYSPTQNSYQASSQFSDQSEYQAQNQAPAASPFQPVSYSEPGSQINAPNNAAAQDQFRPSDGQPQQWRGPSRQSSARPAGAQWTAPKDPPNWRARRN